MNENMQKSHFLSQQTNGEGGMGMNGVGCFRQMLFFVLLHTFLSFKPYFLNKLLYGELLLTILTSFLLLAALLKCGLVEYCTKYVR